MDTDAHALADFVARGGLFVLTGAGLSTESGIPDYRRPDGTRRTVPMTFQQFIATPEARRRYWARSAVGWELFDAARPNVGHVAVAVTVSVMVVVTGAAVTVCVMVMVSLMVVGCVHAHVSATTILFMRKRGKNDVPRPSSR